MERYLKRAYEDKIKPLRYDDIENHPKNRLEKLYTQPYDKKVKSSHLKRKIARLSLYMMLGCDAQTDINLILTLIKSKSLQEKRVGCVFASMLLNSNPGLISVFKDALTTLFLDQKNKDFVPLALSVVSCCITKEVAKELGHFVADVAISQVSPDATQMKALLTLATIYSKAGVYSSVDEVIPKITELLKSSNMEKIAAACTVAISIQRGGVFSLPKEVFDAAFAIIVSVYLEGKNKKTYMVDDITDPFAMIKVLRLLRYKKDWNEGELLKMSDAVAKFLVLRKNKRSDRGKNAYIMVFSEAILTATQNPLQKKVAFKVTNILINNMSSQNESLYDFSLKGLSNLARLSPDSRKTIFEHRGRFLKILYSKRRPFDELALDLLYNASKGFEKEAENIFSAAIPYVQSYLKMKTQVYCCNIIMSNPNQTEAISKGVDALLKGTKEFAEKMWPKLAHAMMKQDSSAKQNTEACLQILTANPRCNEGFVKLTAFMAGQFGHLCECSGNAIIELLLENFDMYTGSTQTSIITAMTKLSAHIPELHTPAIEYMYDHLSSHNLDVVQRCREAGAMMATQEMILKKTLQTPKFTRITLNVAQEPQDQSFNPFGQTTAAPAVQSPTKTLRRQPSEGQWQGDLVIHQMRSGSARSFEIPTEDNDLEANIGPLITVLEDTQDESDEETITSGQSPEFMTRPVLSEEEALNILEQFRTNKRGVLYEGEEFTILGMVETKGPIASLTYKIQNFSSIPMSIDSFDVNNIDGIEFALSVRPNVIGPNGYVIIRDHARTNGVFTAIPQISISIGGYNAAAPVPILPFMWSSPLSVDQQTFVARWKALKNSSVKDTCSIDVDSVENAACEVVKRELAVEKLDWSPHGRPAFMGSFKTAKGNIGYMMIFIISGNSVTIEFRATNKNAPQYILTLIKNALLRIH